MSNRLLLIGDDQVILTARSVWIRRCQPIWDISTATDRISALDTLQGQPVAIAVLDAQGPAIDDLRLAAQIQLQSPTTQLIVLTDDPATWLSLAAKHRCSVFRFHDKTCSADVLLQSICAALEHSADRYGMTIAASSPSSRHTITARPAIAEASIAILIVDADCHLLKANRRARALLFTSDPIYVDNGGVLCVQDARINCTLGAAVKLICAGGATRSFRLEAPGASQETIAAISPKREANGAINGVMISVMDHPQSSGGLI